MAHPVRMTKPWRELTAASASSVGGHMGVYQLGDGSGNVVRIGFAGGRSRFGLAGELDGCVGQAELFRCEITTAYRSRYLELLMAHVHDHGDVPPGNDEQPGALGRLSPA